MTKTDEIKPTKEQLAAIKLILDEVEEGYQAVLVGPAGTGKTTVMKWLIAALNDKGRGVVLATPTGKAAVRLTQLTGQLAKTIHSRLYSHFENDDRGDLQFDEPGPPCEAGEVLIVDEASMIGKKIYRHVIENLPEGSAVIWVGDHEQLEPVKDTWGPNLLDPTARLTTVHRQSAQNPIISYATAVREGAGSGFRRGYSITPDDRLTFSQNHWIREAVKWAVSRQEEGVDYTVITFRNATRKAVNKGVRKALGYGEGVVVGDKILCKMNAPHIGIMNGEILDVTGVEYVRRLGHDGWKVETAQLEKPVYILKHLLNDTDNNTWNLRRGLNRNIWERSRVIMAWHGFCLSVHSSQGSEWDEVAFLLDSSIVRMGMDFARRLTYTGVTRAKNKLTVMMK